jgi:hypothetical protein
VTSRMWRAFRPAVAITGMALSFLLSSQTAFAVAHQIDHAQYRARSHALLPDDFLGDVVYLSLSSPAAPDTAPAETSGTSDHELSGSMHHHVPDRVDHRHGGSLLVFLIAQTVTLTNCAPPRLRCEFVPQSAETFSPNGPVIAAKPTAPFDAKWGGFVIDPAFFTRLVYRGV